MYVIVQSRIINMPHYARQHLQMGNHVRYFYRECQFKEKCHACKKYNAYKEDSFACLIIFAHKKFLFLAFI